MRPVSCCHLCTAFCLLAGGGLVAPLAATLVASQGAFGQNAVPWGQARIVPVMACKLESPYPSDARAPGLEGLVIVEAVVEANGTVSKARVVHSVDTSHGLDDAAIAEVRSCRIDPSSRRDQPSAAVVMRIPVLFRLHRPGLMEGDPDSQSAADKVFAGNAYSDRSPGLVLPELIFEQQASYTPEAMKDLDEVDIWFDVVVGQSGLVQRLRRLVPTGGLGDGLDGQAEAALRKWRFKPATLKGVSVASVVQVQMSFRVH